MKRRRDLLASTQAQYHIAYMAENLVFTGNSYIDTGVYLYSQENINRDFVIELNLTADLATEIQPDRQATVLNSMLERSPYPGFVLRKAGSGSNRLQLSSNGNAIIPPPYDNTAIRISRQNGEYGLMRETTIIDTTSAGIRSGVFDVPVTLGASLDGSGNPFRYFIGTINRIKIILF